MSRMKHQSPITGFLALLSQIGIHIPNWVRTYIFHFSLFFGYFLTHHPSDHLRIDDPMFRHSSTISNNYLVMSDLWNKENLITNNMDWGFFALLATCLYSDKHLKIDTNRELKLPKLNNRRSSYKIERWESYPVRKEENIPVWELKDFPCFNLLDDGRRIPTRFELEAQQPENVLGYKAKLKDLSVLSGNLTKLSNNLNL